jgi:hypothetical protein
VKPFPSITVAVSLALLWGCSPAADAPPEPSPPAAAPVVAPLAPSPTPAPVVDPTLDAHVRDYARDGTLPLRYVTARTGDDPQALTLVYLMGGDYCGSGGCTLLILRKNADLYERLGRLTVVRTPIRVLQTSSHGMPDLAVAVSGGGATPHEALIPFDGQRYAPNPTTSPARTLPAGTPGRILIDDDTPKVTVRE